jgi:hypothetical protein
VKAKIAFIEPGNIVASITLTMTVEHWKKLRTTMDGSPYYSPWQQVRAAVDELTAKVERAIHYETDDGSTPNTKGGDHG